jgi:hypothetical protein
VTGYGWDGRESIPGRSKIFSSSPQCPDRLWSPSSLLSNGYWGLCSLGWSDQGVNLTSHLYLVMRSRMVELYPHSLIRLYGIVLNSLHTGTTLPLYLLPFLSRWTWVMGFTLRPLSPQQRTSFDYKCNPGWAPEPIRHCGERTNRFLLQEIEHRFFVVQPIA